MTWKSLIIDDERPVQIAVSKLGHWKKYNIEPPLTADNGHEGLLAMREMHPNVVFVDMQMPVMDGISFLQQASSEFPDAKFIIISGYDDFAYAQQAIRYGAIDYLLKPIVASDLDSAIQKAVLSIDPDFTLYENTSDIEEDVTPDEVIEIIKTYIEKNYSQNISLAMFADKYFFSKEYLSKLFKVKYSCGIYEYAQNIRMERAAELLRNPAIKIQDISKRLGYTDNNYFSKAFRNFYGMTPTRYRESIGS